MSDDDLFAHIGGTEEERERARARLAAVAARSRIVMPIRTPRGLDAVTGALAPILTHSEIAALLNTAHDGLDGLTPVEWLAEDGAAFEVIAVLAKEDGPFGTAVLVDQLVTLLGSEMIAYIVSLRDTTTVHWWREGTAEPTFEMTERLAATFHAAFILRSALTDGAIHSWMKRGNPQTDDVSPAQLLRNGPLSAVFTVLAAARQLAARPELHRPVTVEDVLARARQLWAEPSATEWLYSRNETYLNGARPIDLVNLGRGQEVLDALDGVEQGGLG